MACVCIFKKKGVKTAYPLQASRVKNQASGPFWQKTKQKEKKKGKKVRCRMRQRIVSMQLKGTVCSQQRDISAVNPTIH